MASSRSEENVNPRHFPTQDGVTVLVSPAILLDCLGLTFSSDLEEAMFETGESLSIYNQKFNSVIEKINQSTSSVMFLSGTGCFERRFSL